MKKERVCITLDHDQLQLLDGIEGLGDTRSSKVKHALISWMSEKGYFKKKNNNH